MTDSPDPAAVASVARTWEGRAERYDQYYRAYAEAGRDAWRSLYREAIDALLGPAEPPLRVLDVGTGTGFAAVLLAELGHEVTGVDASERMLTAARAEATRRGVTIRWRHGDGHTPPEGPYDLVTCRYVLWTLPAPGAALAAWGRALRPGGAVLVADGLWHTARQLLRFPRLLPGAARDYLGMGRTLPYWRGITALQAAGLLRSAGFGPPRHFEHLMPPQRHRDSRDFFVIGAKREE
ncbi:class I SAM-dependent methyltransferase [Streptomyces litchfieldiae]|uniref:Class I SAM-dependent methyltransferase n=1 Tax=Streptomyces litchfieldiae TaxID=3075543 RepID=A0ABU2MVQ0_9ACTN|nr:class I SAM-dependent methyltransferase [Streptomyces sp. DSM 44938]MDT0345716.1 class I SAM-dependent methyltransferase [Streptomyces sp. DSM 44938]